MTSANPGGEPLVTDNDEARARLAGIADALPRCTTATSSSRCDDSVRARAARRRRRALPVRPPRARLHAARDPPARAPARRCSRVGGYFKNTVCVTRGDEAFLSQHVGDLDNAPTCTALERTIDHLRRHPRRARRRSSRTTCIRTSTARATRRALAARWGVPLRAVQHHHAHVAAVLAEHRVDGPVLGLALDGVGLGSDGGAWGGELLRVDGASFARIGHLRPLRLARRRPRGARAVADGGGGARARRTRRRDRSALRATSRPRAPSPRCSRAACARPRRRSMGRWFDAAAGLLGVTRRMAFEGQAAMLLEGLAERHGAVAGRSVAVRDLATTSNSTSTPLVQRLADERDAGFGARALPRDAGRGARRVGRAGGRARIACRSSRRRRLLPQRDLSRAACAPRSRGAASRCSKRRRVPPNDGGLALGQAWVAPADASTGDQLTMCLAIPARVVALPEPDTALVDVGGVRKRDLARARRRRRRRRLRDRPRRLCADAARSRRGRSARSRRSPQAGIRACGRPHEVHRRIPRRRASRASSRRRSPREAQPRPPLQPDGVLRRPHARDLALRPRRPAARQRADDPRPGLPGVRAADRPHRQRDRARAAAGAHPVHVRRHDARARVEGPVAAEGEGARRRHPDGLFERRRGAHRAGEPGPRGRVLRDRLRDDDAADRRRDPAGRGARARQLQRVLQPRADAGGDHQHPRVEGGARARHGAARRLHRPGARVDGDRQPARTSTSPRSTSGRSSSPASSRST